MHLLHQPGISGETAGIQIAHLIDQRLQLLPRFRTVLHGRPNLVEKTQALFNLALCIGRVGTLLGRGSATGDASVSGVNTAIRVAIAIGGAGRGIAHFAGDAISNSTRLAAASLTCLLSRLAVLPGLLTRLLASLPGLWLPGLPVAIELPRLELLSGAARLTLSSKSGQLVAQAR